MEKIVKTLGLHGKLIFTLLIICGCKKTAKVLSTSDLLKGRWQLIAASSVPVYLKDSVGPSDMFPSLAPCATGYFLNFNAGNMGSVDTSCNMQLLIKWSLLADSLFMLEENPDSLFNSRKINELNQQNLKTARIVLPPNDTPVLVYESYIRR